VLPWKFGEGRLLLRMVGFWTDRRRTKWEDGRFLPFYQLGSVRRGFHEEFIAQVSAVLCQGMRREHREGFKDSAHGHRGGSRVVVFQRRRPRFDTGLSRKSCGDLVDLVPGRPERDQEAAAEHDLYRMATMTR
jgi:hypothetical protein